MSLKDDLIELRNKITPGPWEVGAMELRFIRNYMPPSSCLTQPTRADLEFIAEVRNRLDEIIDAIPD